MKTIYKISIVLCLLLASVVLIPCAGAYYPYVEKTIIGNVTEIPTRDNVTTEVEVPTEGNLIPTEGNLIPTEGPEIPEEEEPLIESLNGVVRIGIPGNNTTSCNIIFDFP